MATWTEVWEIGLTAGLLADLTPSERRVLAFWVGTRTIDSQEAVACQVGIHRGNVATALSGLVRKGWLIRHPHRVAERTRYEDGPVLRREVGVKEWLPRAKVPPMPENPSTTGSTLPEKSDTSMPEN